MRADESAHILNDSGDGELHLSAEGDTLLDVNRCDLLRCSDDDRTALGGQELGNGKGLITCPGRAIDHKGIEISPGNMLEKLLL